MVCPSSRNRSGPFKCASVGGSRHGAPPVFSPWAGRIREWQGSGRDASAYFTNDGDGAAVHNARRLRELLAGTD
ncbi:DUF72 domain-containing protein [Arthrobacter luteolus]|uniref:DUF72 domain-containing protein n=1 Tax=Arthrobacter luteolus TaxID=98672 RepID=UPI0009F8D68E